MATPSPGRTGRWRRGALLSAAALVIFLTSVLSYSRIVSFPLLAFDPTHDTEILMRRLAVSAESDWQPLRLVSNIWIEGTLRLWRPLNSLLFEGYYRGFGDRARAWHALSLLVHSLNAVALFFLLRLLFRNTWAAGISAWLFSLRIPVALVSFLLDNKSSLHREKLLGWVAGLGHLNMSLCYLVALALALYYAERGKRWAWPAALLSFALAFGFKEDAVTLPLVLTGMILIRGGVRRLWPFLASFWLLDLVFALAWRGLMGGEAVPQNLTFRPAARVIWWWGLLLAGPLPASPRELSTNTQQWAVLWVGLSISWFLLLRKRALRSRLAFLLATLASLCIVLGGGLLIFGEDYGMLRIWQPWTAALHDLVFLWVMVFLLVRRPRELALGVWWVAGVFVPSALITAGRQSPQDYYLPEIWPAMLAGLFVVEVVALLREKLERSRAASASPRAEAPAPPGGGRPPGTSLECGR